jgi:hypothetical protein
MICQDSQNYKLPLIQKMKSNLPLIHLQIYFNNLKRKYRCLIALVKINLIQVKLLMKIKGLKRIKSHLIFPTEVLIENNLF